MLVRFRSPAAADLIMFGAVATELLRLMGLSGRIPSAVQAEDLPAVRDRLRAGLAAESAAPPAAGQKESGEDPSEARDYVPLRTRAQPLQRMIDAAIRKNTYVMWEPIR